MRALARGLADASPADAHQRGSASPMKVLVVSPWFPWPPFGGALIRVFETIRHLSQRHSVTLLAPVTRQPDLDHLNPLSDLCERVVPVVVSETAPATIGRMAAGLARGLPLIAGLHFSRRFARRLRDLTTAGHYDVVHVEHSFMAPYLSWIGPRSRARTVLSMHNIESLRFRRELQTAVGARRLAIHTDSVLFHGWEERAVRRFDGVVTVSDEEAAWARRQAPATPTVVVPNGVDIEYYRDYALPRASPAPGLIVFAALMNYPPNVDAARWFAGAVFPLIALRHPGVRFRIVGDKPTAEVRSLADRPGIEVTGRVQDVRPHLAESSVVVVPLRSGAGTRLKILEAMAAGRPVVSTSIGAEGLDVAHGVHLLIGDTREEMANHVAALLARDDMRAGLAARGLRLASERYDWRTCFRSLDELYGTMVTTPGPEPPEPPGVAS
jgi:sugar transferase (PEP-CTERM/EpsH1 system associated)